MSDVPQSQQKSWYLVYTKPRHEELALANLMRQGYQAYLPRLRHWRKRRGKRVEVIEPLFPRYLFILLDNQLDNWSPIRSTLGVTSLVRFGTDPARVPDAFVAHLQERENAEGLHEWVEPALVPGDTVRVAEGPFQGYEGVVLAPTGQERVILLLDLVGREVRTQVSRSQIERA